jgi:hypothetical protein
MVAAMCGENGIKKREAWKLLKEAGFVPKTTPPPTDEGLAGMENQDGAIPPTPLKNPAKKRIKHEHLNGKKLIVGSKTVEFDADGIAELEAADVERLLTIPGYTEVKE